MDKNVLFQSDYQMLGSAINSLSYKQLLNFYSVIDYIQNALGIMCTEED